MSVKILLVGNCQMVPLAAFLRLLLPEADIWQLWLESVPSEEIEAVHAAIDSFDVVCTHLVWRGPFVSSTLRGSTRNLIFVPALVFTGFHPDEVVVGQVRGPVGLGHSAIIISSWLLDLSPIRCARLFNAFIYASLGYFDRFGEAKTRLLQQAANYGLPLDEYFTDWPAPFMRDVQHPKFEPLATVAEQLARRIMGRAALVDWTASAREQFDAMKFGGNWPLYPEIAARLGLPADDMRFRRLGTMLSMDLPQFIDRWYETYAAADRSVLTEAVKIELPILTDLVLSRPVAGGIVAA